MKAEMKIETTIELNMTLKEAGWLQGLLQNPRMVFSEEDQKTCKNFALTLGTATRRQYMPHPLQENVKCEGGSKWNEV
jgi:hypothetical protein